MRIEPDSNPFKSRKFILCIVIEGLAAAALFAGLLPGIEPLITSSDFTNISLANIGAYNLANMGETISANRAKANGVHHGQKAVKVESEAQVQTS